MPAPETRELPSDTELALWLESEADIQIKIHPVVHEFPKLSDEQFAELSRSLGDIGFVEPLLRCKVGGEDYIIDGLHRLSAVYLMTGKRQRELIDQLSGFLQYVGDLDDTEVFQVAKAANVARRHVSYGQWLSLRDQRSMKAGIAAAQLVKEIQTDQEIIKEKQAQIQTELDRPVSEQRVREQLGVPKPTVSGKARRSEVDPRMLSERKKIVEGFLKQAPEGYSLDDEEQVWLDAQAWYEQTTQADVASLEEEPESEGPVEPEQEMAGSREDIRKGFQVWARSNQNVFGRGSYKFVADYLGIAPTEAEFNEDIRLMSSPIALLFMLTEYGYKQGWREACKACGRGFEANAE